MAFLLDSEDYEGVSSLFEHQLVRDPQCIVLELLSFVVLCIGKEGFPQYFIAFQSIDGVNDAVVQRVDA